MFRAKGDGDGIIDAGYSPGLRAVARADVATPRKRQPRLECMPAEIAPALHQPLRRDGARAVGVRCDMNCVSDDLPLPSVPLFSF
jgi:hypothetical protein